MLSTGTNALYSCPVLSSSHGIHPCWPLSQPQSPWPCCGSQLHPFITQPSVRPLQAVSTFLQRTPIPWRIKWVITVSGALTLCSHPCTLFSLLQFVMESLRGQTHRGPFGQPATSLHFAQSLDGKGFPVFPVSPQTLQSARALSGRSAGHLSLAFEASSLN